MCHLPKLYLTSSDIHLTFTWSPDHHLTFPWPLPKHKCQVRTIWPSSDIHLISPNIHMKFTWPSPDHLTIIWPFPDHYLTIISNFQLKKGCLVVGGWLWWVGQPITDHGMLEAMINPPTKRHLGLNGLWKYIYFWVRIHWKLKDPSGDCGLHSIGCLKEGDI